MSNNNNNNNNNNENDTNKNDDDVVDYDYDYDYDVIIVGGGIAGMACAVALAERGIKRVCICEKARVLQRTGAALGLFPNGFAALEAISSTVTQRISESAIPATKMEMKNLKGEVIKEINLSSGGAPPMVLPTFLVWYLLQEYLKDELPDGVLNLGHAIESFSVVRDNNNNENHPRQVVKVRILNRFTNETETKTCRVLIGADGIKSMVRTILFGKGGKEEGEEDRSNTNTTMMKCHGKRMFRAVLNTNKINKGICPPAGTSTSYQGEEKGKLFALRETAKGILTITAMAKLVEDDELPLLPDDDASTTTTKMIQQQKQPSSSSSSSSKEEENNDRNKQQQQQRRHRQLRELFSEYPRDVVGHVIERIPPSSLYVNAVYDIDVEEEWSKGPVVLIGDAAHAMTPGLGQGANQGLEDACELAISLAPVLLRLSLKKEEDYTTTTATTHDDDDDDDDDEKTSSNKNHNDNDNGKSSNNNNSVVSDVLERFWRCRIDRVREIHAASRAKTESVNQSSSKKVAYSSTNNNDNKNKEASSSSLTDRIYQWKPSNL